MILPTVRDPRLMTIRRGGTLTDADHHLLALWAATALNTSFPCFEAARPSDRRPRAAIRAARAWAHGDLTMMTARAAGGHAMGAARDLRGAERFAAYAAGQAAVVAHVAEHDLGAAAYAIGPLRRLPRGEGRSRPAGASRWRRGQRAAPIRALVLDDQRHRNDLCWSVFDL